ncbi:enoyl-CoA hydratase/carnithine racemase [Bradyrhizobium sp. AZCC 1578]|uniref:enoyl-CoA hydratase/isomerase family protein n=1 Tax=Bradyrhizobium sp. AZCC 1578 TaxID=3117027 RepID=UPI002FF24841
MTSVRFEKLRNVGLITLDNPPINLVDDDLLLELGKAIDEVDSSGVRAVLLHATGDHFGPGVNVKTTFSGVNSRGGRKMLTRAIPIVLRLEQLDIPIVCAVQGFCFAASLELALRCDVIIASEEAKFAQVERDIGAATYLGGIYLLAERCGPARAREICLTGERYDAAVFERWNIVNRVVPRASLYTEALAWAQKFADGPTKAYAVNERLLRGFLDYGTRGADELLLDIGPPLFDSEDFKAGVQSVVEYGAKNFRGKVVFRGS